MECNLSALAGIKRETMESKTLTTLVIVLLCILFFPIAIGIVGGIFGLIGTVIGGFFGLIGGLLGGIFGIIGGLFGAIFGFFGWLFGETFHWGWHWPGFFHSDAAAIVIIIIVIVLVSRSRRVR